ncbi:hypothetical protein TBLA_0F02930 [Henningerozyma blattae CBS 6284]|uniref:Uncharacterized protein n=1 Tax=Henningerozyma blattae (strain ATCC 34711 / CBS 6284 / DSM 70876 / NBRC 10599 / NRRL Y-10934 / UCD 77-7) TaxID=1071380 RepID=I2H630_HENB6|nr:hypothetical protein TBLA_0F02930 [Tetrapisispora blattae CBS 6284]CCH61832.1 hypothetical protein TBLA_0F02930 [Tetrapisispora blattae CBS 6284]
MPRPKTHQTLDLTQFLNDTSLATWAEDDIDLSKITLPPHSPDPAGGRGHNPSACSNPNTRHTTNFTRQKNYTTSHATNHNHLMTTSSTKAQAGHLDPALDSTLDGPFNGDSTRSHRSSDRKRRHDSHPHPHPQPYPYPYPYPHTYDTKSTPKFSPSAVASHNQTQLEKIRNELAHLSIRKPVPQIQPHTLGHSEARRIRAEIEAGPIIDDNYGDVDDGGGDKQHGKRDIKRDEKQDELDWSRARGARFAEVSAETTIRTTATTATTETARPKRRRRGKRGGRRQKERDARAAARKAREAGVENEIEAIVTLAPNSIAEPKHNKETHSQNTKIPREHNEVHTKDSNTNTRRRRKPRPNSRARSNAKARREVEAKSNITNNSI